MSKFTIRPLNTGYVTTIPKQYLYHHSVTLYLTNIPDHRIEMPVFTFLIEGGEKLVLVDTGMSWTERANGKGDVEIIPGIRVFETPGHSPGHMSVEIDTTQGSFLCVGDSIFVPGKASNCKRKEQKIIALSSAAMTRIWKRRSSLPPFLARSLTIAV